MHNRYSFFPFRFPRKIASDISLIFITLPPSLPLLFFFHILLTLSTTWNTQRAIRGFINRVTDSNKLGVRAGFFSSLWPRGNYIKVAICKGWKEDFPPTKAYPLVPLEYLKMNLYVTPNRNGLAKFSNSKGASSASKVSLESNLDSKLLQFSVRGGEKRRGNVDSSETGSTQLRTEGRRLKGGEEGRKVRFRRGNLTGERVQRMGRMGDRVTLSRGERRWMRGEGREGWMGRWMDGKTAKRREREKNFVRRKQASFERERERERSTTFRNRRLAKC